MGCGRSGGGEPDILVTGTGVEVDHCCIENVNSVVTLHPNADMISIDGLQVTKPTRLTQGKLLFLFHRRPSNAHTRIPPCIPPRRNPLSSRANISHMVVYFCPAPRAYNGMFVSERNPGPRSRDGSGLTIRRQEKVRYSSWQVKHEQSFFACHLRELKRSDGKTQRTRVSPRCNYDSSRSTGRNVLRTVMTIAFRPQKFACFFSGSHLRRSA